MFALRLLRADRAGDALPPAPPVPAPTEFDDAAGFTGAYRGDAGTLDLAAEGNRLVLRHDEARLALERHGKDAFLVAHPDFARFPLRFGREGDWVVEACHGARWHANERYDGPTAFDHPPAWTAYRGHYRSHNPWGTNFRVVLRKGALVLIEPSGDEEPLAPLDHGTFRIGDDEASPERLRFDAVVGGHALRANWSGCDFYRFFTP